MKIFKRHVVLTATLSVVIIAVCFLNFKNKLYAINSNDYWLNDACNFSLMTYNEDATESSKFTFQFQHDLINLISFEKPDILCFQELSFENLKKIKPQLDSIYGSCDELKGDDQLWRLRLYSHYPLRNFKRYHCEGEIETNGFDSLALAEYGQIQRQMPVMSAEFEIEPGRWVTVFSGHLRSSAYSTARRSMDKDKGWLEGISLYWRNYKIGKRIRDYEAKNVRRFIDKAISEGKPVIVAGDLNDWCGSDCLNTLMGNDLKDAWWEGGNGFGWTYFGWHLRLRLDHILYRKEFKLEDVKVIDSDISDHKPLMARFSFN